MERWNWNVVRAYIPATLALVIAYVSTWVLAGWQADPASADLAGRLGWVPVAALAVALVNGAWVSARLWRVERGAMLLCACGGLLGGERDDRRGRPVRTCKTCGRRWTL